MGNTPRRRHPPTRPAAGGPAPTDPEAAEKQLPPGRERGADPQRTIAHLSRMRAEESSELAAAHALVDELEAENAELRGAVENLQNELVATTSRGVAGAD